MAQQSSEENRTIVIEKTTFLQETEKSHVAGASEPERGLFVDIQPALQRTCRIRNRLVRELIAEAFGIFLLCLIGLASVAQFVFFKREGSVPQASFLAVNLGFGIGVIVAILVTGKVSGCHINPAVSLAMFLTGRLSLLKLALYVVAQVVGAFLAAAVVFVLYYDALITYDNIMYSLNTAGIFATYPAGHLSIWGGVFDQILGTAVLIIVVLAVTDRRNVEMPHASVAILLGLTVTVIGMAFAYNCGYAINPARDFGPRLFTWMAGWGSQVFTAGHHFFWVPIVAPLIGALIGTLIYLFLISIHF